MTDTNPSLDPLKPLTEQFVLAQVRARRSVLASSFSRSAQTLVEATESARSMASSLESKGLLLRTPQAH